MRWGTLLIVLVVLASICCCKGTNIDNDIAGDIEKEKISRKKVIMQEKTAELTPETLEGLTRAHHPTIAIVRCEKAETIFAGTQSESRIVHATIVKAGIGLEEGRLSFRFFASKTLNMKTGRLYLVAAYGSPGREELPLFERVEILPETATEALYKALEVFKKLQKNDGD